MGGVGRWRRSLGKHWSSLILILIRSKADEGFVNLCPSGFFVKLDNFVNAASFRQIQNNARWRFVTRVWQEGGDPSKLSERCTSGWYILPPTSYRFRLQRGRKILNTASSLEHSIKVFSQLWGRHGKPYIYCYKILNTYIAVPFQWYRTNFCILTIFPSPSK